MRERQPVNTVAGVNVELYADPSCPWSWAAYLWLDEVAPRRQLRVRVRPFSLALRDGVDHLPDPLRTARQQAHRALRVAVAIDDDAAGCQFYAAATGALYAGVAAGRGPAIDIPAALGAAGLDTRLAARADDESLDADIRESMVTLQALLPAGEATKQTIPVLVLDAPRGRRACHGPLLDPAPRGHAALQLWDAIETLLEVDGVYQIARPRPARHSLLAPAS